MSSRSVENSFDLEAQETVAETCSSVDHHHHHPARLRAIILLIRSTEIFKLQQQQQQQGSPPTHFSSITTSHPHPQDLEITVADEEDGISTVVELNIAETVADEEVSISESEGRQTVELNNNTQQRKSISEIVRNKNLHELRSFGGVKGVAQALNTHLEIGISISPEKQIFHNSHHPTQLYKLLVILLHSFLKATNNYTIFLLSIAAILSLAFGVNQDDMHGFGWFNGAVLISNIFLIIIFTTIHNCWQEWTSVKKLDNISWHSNLRVPTIRGGNDCQLIDETDLVVGDIVILRKGCQVPGDGLFVISTGDQPLELNDGSANRITIVDENNPFLFYGSRVVNGDAKMLVTSTRTDTEWGKMMSQAILEETNNSKLEYSIHNLNMCVHISGLLISILIIIVLFLRYKAAGKMDDERKYRPDPKGEPTRVITITDAIMGILRGTKGTAGVLTTLLSLSFLGITEGVPVVISFATIIWGRKMLADKATARDNLSWLKLASVTTIICTDRFSELTEHVEKKIEKLFVGEDIVSESSVVASEVLEGLCDGITAMQFLIAKLVPEVKISWAEANLGFKTESVIEMMTSHGGRNPFQERCQVLMEKNGNVRYLHFCGPPLDILSLCSHHYNINGILKEIDGPKRRMLQGILFANEEARFIAYACKRVVGQYQPNNDDLILLAMISLKDVRIEDTKDDEAVSSMMEVGVRTILASEDDISMLEPIAQNCGLVAPGSDDHLVLTGEEFRNWGDEERTGKLDKIRVIGNCLQSDKYLLIKCLQSKGEVVAFLAQRTIDAPALKQVDIGLTFGTRSSQVAREFSDITIWDFDCNIGFMVDVIKNGRCFQDNIRRFIQLQLVFTISSTMINFIAVVSLGDAPITPVQLFWLNLVVSLVGGLGLLTGTSSSSSSTVPANKLISKAMWRNIMIQATYQITICVTLQHKGQAVLGTSAAGRIKSVIFNGFFLCQLFNLLIAREPERKNIFGGVFRSNNFWFWVSLVVFVICQGVFGVAERVLGSISGLSFRLWGACLLIALVSFLLDWAGKSMSSTFNLIIRLVSVGGRNMEI